MDKIFTIEGIEYPRFINSKVAGKIINFENLIRKERTLRSQQKDIDYINLLNDLRVISFGARQVPIMTPYTEGKDYILVDYFIKEKSLCILHEINHNPNDRATLTEYGFEVMKLNKFDRTMSYLKSCTKGINDTMNNMANLMYAEENDVVDLPTPDFSRVAKSCRQDVEILAYAFPEILEYFTKKKSDKKVIDVVVPIRDLMDMGVTRYEVKLDCYKFLVKHLLKEFNINLVITTKQHKGYE